MTTSQYQVSETTGLEELFRIAKANNFCARWGCTTCGSLDFKKLISKKYSGFNNLNQEMALSIVGDLKEIPNLTHLDPIEYLIIWTSFRLDDETKSSILGDSPVGRHLARMLEHRRKRELARIENDLRSDPELAAKNRVLKREAKAKMHSERLAAKKGKDAQWWEKAEDLLCLARRSKKGTSLPADLIEAYRQTHFHVGREVASPFLKVGQTSDYLRATYENTGFKTAAIITAWNPYSQAQSDAQNRAANVNLKGQLEQVGDLIIYAEGRDPKGEWPAEESFLVFGIAFRDAIKIGRDFGQNAIVFGNETAVPKLILLR